MTTEPRDAAAVYVYAITFDYDVYGIFLTRESAEADLARQIAAGGPAWDGCRIQKWAVQP